MMDYFIDYATVLPPGAAHDYVTASALLTEQLPPLWLNAYHASCSHEPNVLQITIDHFEHLFDFTSDPSLDAVTEAPEDRLVVVYGYSRPPASARDASRMKGFLGTGLRGDDKLPRDKGHFIAHSAGGGLDINLFPQRPELNRGRSEEGKVFREMERFAAGHPGTFVFARPIYHRASWTPDELEYGLLMPDVRLWVERFSN